MDVKKTLLLIIDVQNDFCTGGALAVSDGETVVSPLNALSGAFSQKGGMVAVTQDWHGDDHVSFGIWPKHCVKGTKGADFHPGLDLNPVTFIIRKGFRQELDSYSAFFENDSSTATGLEGCIKQTNIQTVIIGGLATDYCVLYSAMDSRRLGFHTIVVSDAVRGVNNPEGSVEKAIETMKNAGIEFRTSQEILSMVNG
ncbi:MAG: nicotinamidase [Treponema sp.]|nr:nicotinamidase [Treponema sp.]